MDSRPIFKEIRNYLAGRFLGATRDEAILEEVIKCLFLRIKSPDAVEIASNENDTSKRAQGLRNSFSEIKKLYGTLFDPHDELLLGAEELSWTVNKLAEVDFLESDRDEVGEAYETFIGSGLRGQEGQFFTPRNAIRFLVDAISPKSHETVIDPACGSGGFLSIAYLSMKERRSTANLYGIDKDLVLVRLARIHMALLGASLNKIIHTDSIAAHNGLELPGTSLPAEGEYDVVLTNPPFGAKIISASRVIASKYSLAQRWEQQDGRWTKFDDLRTSVPPQVLFLEKCIKLLKPGGRCGMVVPESLVTSTQYRYAIAFLLQNSSIRLVAGMPESLFKTSGKGGTHTKTCLLVFEKKPTRKKIRRDEIFFAEAKWCGNDSRGRGIPNDDLPRILESFRRWERSEPIAEDLLGYSIPTESLEDLSLSPRRYNPETSRQLAAAGRTHRVVTIGDLVKSGALEITTGNEIGKLAYGTGSVPFVRTSDISNWEIKFDPKHCVSEEIYTEYSKRQDVQENDILMVKDGTYLIGSCALITKQDLKIVYQSHIFKLRINKNALGLDPFLLLAIMGSEIVQSQIRAKRVTHDIIDSLGTRINEIYLPIPKKAQSRAAVASLVSKVITHRIEAKRLAQEARKLVVEPLVNI